jgi:hypothetical protein
MLADLPLEHGKPKRRIYQRKYDDRTKDSDRQNKKTDIFAAGNEKPDIAAIPACLRQINN